MRLFFCFSILLVNSLHAQKTEILHAYNSNWEAIEDINNASFIMSTIKENDSLYTCRYYHILGPMIYLESYKDKALEIPNGFFAWYDTTGRIDSLGYVHNGKKNGKWVYGFNDSGKTKIKATLISQNSPV
jgi:antitoxin component YwqK of YwqJK toxin-antitoxin module